MIVLRRLLGDVLRKQRVRQGRTLRQVSGDARVSLGYISEIERGQKEASSEMLAALCGALEVPLSDVLREVSDRLALEEARAASARPLVTPEERRLSLAAEPVVVPVRPARDGDVVAAA
jgi:transcriptional regulator with XRE-family HTH domain